MGLGIGPRGPRTNINEEDSEISAGINALAAELEFDEESEHHLLDEELNLEKF